MVGSTADGDGGGGDELDPVEPVKPVEPVELVKPVEPVELVEPVEPVEVEQAEKVTGEEIWAGADEDDPHHEDLFIDVNEPSIFYNDFPPLPDFSCMSSSSSTSATPAPAKPIVAASSTSSVASWALIKSGDAEGDRRKDKNLLHAEEQPFNPAPVEAGDGGFCDMDCMENFGYIDLMDSNEIWDPSSIFRSEGDQEADQNMNDNNNESDDLGLVFFEWLKSNKEHITAEDMRKIKLRKSTVESASRKLGSSKEGKKQLLKLILEWVEQSQLQKRRMRDESDMVAPPLTNQPNPNIVFNGAPNFSPSTWMPPPPPPYPMSQVMAGYMPPDPYSNNILNYHHLPPTAAGYHFPNVIESAQMWPPPPPPIGGNFTVALGNQQQYPYPAHYYRGLNGEKFLRLGPSATKEARQRRMARQRKSLSHRSRRNHQNQHQHTSQNLNQNVVDEQKGMMIQPDNFPNGNSQTDATPLNWAYWPQPPSSSGVPVMAPGEHPAAQQQERFQVSTQRRQGLKSEKNLKFLLQKVLKQSDVGSLGRIVLPKKEAETNLPRLEARDGIPIAMEDIGTSRIWNMRYRFWPNNKSRMYLLENTGEFVRANELEEGDFIVIYTDMKCGKYLIRGVKVRETDQKVEPKTEVKKKPAKGHKSRSALGKASTTT